MSSDVLPLIIAGLLGGGFFTGLAGLYRAYKESKEKRALIEQSGAKTPSEIESISVSTMTKALESASTRIRQLEAERETDKTYYLGRISELTAQLESVRAELADMELKVATLLSDLAQKGVK